MRACVRACLHACGRAGSGCNNWLPVGWSTREIVGHASVAQSQAVLSASCTSSRF